MRALILKCQWRGWKKVQISGFKLEKGTFSNQTTLEKNKLLVKNSWIFTSNNVWPTCIDLLLSQAVICSRNRDLNKTSGSIEARFVNRYINL